jgi:hypothetical protein
MTDMAELRKRKEPLNLAVVHVDPEAFAANFIGWLEITTFIAAERAGEAQVPKDGVTPRLSAAQMKSGNVERVGNDAMFAFCMTASLRGDKPAVDAAEAAMVEILGEGFPGSAALNHFRETIEAPATLDAFVGQAGKKLLLGEIAPPPLRAKENWNTGLRFFEKARTSNFIHEVMYPLAKWTRACGAEVLEKGVAFLQHIEDNVPILRGALDDPRNDQPFIANYLLKLAPAVDMELNDEYEGLLRSVARR